MATTSHHDPDYVRRRTGLYFGVLLAVDLLAYVSDLIGYWLDTGAQLPEVSPAYQSLRFVVTGMMILGVGASRVKVGRPWVLSAVELGVTLTLAVNYSLLSFAYIGGASPHAAVGAGVLGAVLLLTLRASLVPSPVLRTAAVGAAVMATWYGLGREAIDALPALAREGFLFMGFAFVMATSVTSWVIYGLRREVRRAQRLGQYELGRKLGEGGMGVVYEGTHVMLRRPTAVKLLPADKAGENAVTRFEREVVQTSRLEHPNSVFIYDYGRTPEGQFYYAMEYLDGVTLRALVEAEGALPPGRVLHILKQAAGALAEAHDLGLVHRDIKPANIMLVERAGEPDVVKVLDFGLVKDVDAPDVSVTHESVIVGTPQYLAPEAIRSAEEVGPPTDVYALGAVAYLLLTGREVFVAKTMVEICSLHLTASPEPFAEVSDEPVPAAFEALVRRCLAKDPTERPPDGAALRAALEALEVEGWSLGDARRWWARRAREPVRDPALDGTNAPLTIDLARR